MRDKPIAAISLDLDNLWSYMKTHGDEEWKTYPSYYSIFVPYMLEILRELDIKITFFIVGLDAARQENMVYLKSIAKDGHDFGNHSYNHEVWINQYGKEQFRDDLLKAEKAIFEATGITTKGFRGPGFSWNKSMLEVLHDQGYHYDTSLLPTFLGPLARIYYFWKSDFSEEEKMQRKSLFGPFTEGFRRLKPYFHNLGAGKKFIQIPITTIPFFRIPFHLSYLIYLNSISPVLMRVYLNIAFFLCDLTNTRVNFLLHPLDIIGGDQVTQLAFFPGMNVSSKSKAEVFKQVFIKLKNRYNLVNLSEYYLALGMNKK